MTSAPCGAGRSDWARCTPGVHLDLHGWGAGLGGFRVVGLGEATHGSREFFTFKHRLVEYLVTRHAFTVLSLEADHDGCRGIEAYVRTGQGDPVRGLRELGYWTWNTEEMLGLLIWLRAHNAAAAPGREVRGVGVDPSAPRHRTAAARDRAMAATVLGLVERKVVFWAHNGHVSARYVTARREAAGAHLRRELGAGYYALGLTFGQGTYQALRLTWRGLRGPEEFTAGPPPRRSLEHTFALIGPGDHLVDLRAAAADGELRCWAGYPQRMRSIGSISLRRAGPQVVRIVPGADFDGIAFLHRTTRARTLEPSGVRARDTGAAGGPG